ncbi:hypothetical protein, variant [Verruconis gallopava]|uniref:DBF4-type domain-containing protein n=1 Tax=Verruconis gallopava TaxID=253628 RepID=A0A0D2ABM2_9PEZI|nr:hypothetical protein, variant [Verruconis gallopava]KIW04218.1 hypothetical protein, variant [Verruconis gallopava]
MAALLPPPLHSSPHTNMASRRVPLGNLPNAANSPFREPAAPGSKRPRPDAAVYEKQLQPPTKKQIVEAENADSRRALVGRKVQSTTGTASAVTTRKTSSKATGKTLQQATQENLNEIRQWQRHYKKLFPQMVFYYDNVPDETRHKIGKQLQLLGSREEIFFSKTVTHVVTTRSVPNEATASSSAGRSPPKAGRDGTVNPVYLKKAGTTALHPNDILLRAKEMGIKVWGLEKLQRMLNTMFNAETGEAPVAPYRSSAVTQSKANQQAQLSQMLQKEKEYGQASMDWAADMTAFRGYYIYVHDMDEMTKPIMVRDYSKPATKEQGKWPQLRVNAPGRCPFLDDPSARYERPAPAPDQDKAPRTRAATAREKTPALEERTALAENNNLAQRRQRETSVQADEKRPPMDPPKTIPVKRGSTDNLPLFGSAQASLRQHPRFAGGEPVASGVQQSNATSAIRSQMISSTAAAPGGKAGSTKELNRLQRQVLERNNSVNPYLNNDLRAAINNGGRGQKRKAQDPLANIKEEDDTSEAPRKDSAQHAAPARKKKIVEKEMKPGYCENCRVKFRDFDEHVVSRQHRKFAMDDSNWKELDDLLSLLVRPLKDE